MYWIHPRQGPVEGSCEHSNKLAGSRKRGGGNSRVAEVMASPEEELSSMVESSSGSILCSYLGCDQLIFQTGHQVN
jgi:hypothetical protein